MAMELGEASASDAEDFEPIEQRFFGLIVGWGLNGPADDETCGWSDVLGQQDVGDENPRGALPTSVANHLVLVDASDDVGVDEV